MKLRIATRKSKLARVQTEAVGDLLKQKYGIAYEKVLIETKGDKILNVTLDKIGGKGLFVKDIETAVLEGKADAAVHSMKDVPYAMPEGFEIAAVPLREDVRDVFVSMTGCDFYSLPRGARVGTSSVRRSKQVKMKRADIEIVPIRGNVRTRVEKIEREKLDGIILAAAGLKRLGMTSIITNYFDPLDFVPAVGQGALGVEIAIGSPHGDYFRGIDASVPRMCVEAERSFMGKLHGDCHTAIGAYADIEGDRMNMVGIFDIGGRLIKKEITGHKEDRIKLGERLAELIKKG